VSTTRIALRALVGARLGRRYYVTAVTTGTSTVNRILDTKRTEPADEWDGSTIYFTAGTAPKEALVKGGAPENGYLFLDTDLGSVPSVGATYEILKGYSITDLNDAIDWALAESYPALYLPVNDFATAEVTGTSLYSLAEAWRSITQVRRKISGSSSPVQYEVLSEGNDYFLRHGTAGLVYEANYTTETGITLHFTGRGYPTLDAADASTTIVPSQLIVHGALAYLYDKGSSADEVSMGQKFEQEAQKHLQLFERAKSTYRMRPQRITASFPRMSITNDGSSVEGNW
jgi:hypothetical protein